MFIAATNDLRIRAFSSKTGEELWSARMEATGNATPITYQGRDGQQYVVIAAGGPAHLRNVGDTSQNKGDSLVAFSLEGRESDPVFETAKARPAENAGFSNVLPDAKGKQETLRICTTYHGTATFAGFGMSREEWKAEVDNMLARGARGSEAEIQAVMDYLAQNLGGATPSGGGKMRGVSKRTAFLFLLPTMAQLGHTQSVYGTIAGNVTDTSQAAIVSARVIATNPDTGFTRETLSNSAGVYSVPDVLPGTYAVEVSAPGFQTYKRSGVTVSVQALTRVDVSLAIGMTNDTITVVASSAELQTDRTDVRTDLTSNTLENAPVPIGRNYQMLFVTIPGVSPPTSGHSFGANP